MKKSIAGLFLLLLSVNTVFAQFFTLTGKVVDKNLQPISFASVYVKNTELGTKTDEAGNFTFTLSKGVHEIIFTMLGYKSYTQKIVIDNKNETTRIVLEKAPNVIKEIVIMNSKKDRSVEIIKNVIARKDEIMDRVNAYNVKLYIKANEERSPGKLQRKMQQKMEEQEADGDSSLSKKIRTPKDDSLTKLIKAMSLTEVVLNLDYQKPNKRKETRIGVKKNDYNPNFFYLRTTDGDFNFYNNLVYAPALSETPFLSPISNSGLIAYKFKMLSIVKSGPYKDYHIKVIPTKAGNNLVEGEIIIRDSLWVLRAVDFVFPEHHTPEFEYFALSQEYDDMGDGIWLPSKEVFTYKPTSNEVKDCKTTVVYSNYNLDTIFPKKHFGNELSATAQEAYERDGKFWEESRTEPLSEKEMAYVHYKDSMYQWTHSQAFYDSVDKIENKVTWKKIVLNGVRNYKRSNERTFYIPPIISIWRPLNIGGPRWGLGGNYSKRFDNYTRINSFGSINYGPNNKDILGDLNVSYTYNPFSRGKVTFGIGKNYDVLFNGDAIINFAARSNWFLKKFVSVGHSVELVNGLQLENTLEYAQRSSLYDYKLASPWADSLFGKYGLPIFNNVNRPIDFATYGALYNSITLTYTHKQKYIREPRQKIVLGSKYPSIYFTWRKGVSRVLRSEVDFDYIEAGAKKFVNAGTLGTGRFTFKYGNNVNRRDLRVVDYKWMRRGDPFLFFNPETNFQALDSTFAIFRGFAEGHYYHDFNGALINKIPYAKQVKIFEIAGAGVFILPERNIRYVEAYAGLEKQLKLFGEVFKIGGYLVSSFANEKGNPLQYKFRIRHYNNTYNRWE